MTIGAARPSDLDEPAIAAFLHSTKTDEAIEKVQANLERLHGAEVEALGEDSPCRLVNQCHLHDRNRLLVFPD